MSDPIGAVRIRCENSAVSIYVKAARNRWAVTYAGPNESIEGHCSDTVATRWPLFFTPKYVEGDL